MKPKEKDKKPRDCNSWALSQIIPEPTPARNEPSPRFDPPWSTAWKCGGAAYARDSAAGASSCSTPPLSFRPRLRTRSPRLPAGPGQSSLLLRPCAHPPSPTKQKPQNKTRKLPPRTTQNPSHRANPCAQTYSIAGPTENAADNKYVYMFAGGRWIQYIDTSYSTLFSSQPQSPPRKRHIALDLNPQAQGLHSLGLRPPTWHTPSPSKILPPRA